MRSRDLDLENQSQGHLKVTKAKTLRKMQCCFPIANTLSVEQLVSRLRSLNFASTTFSVLRKKCHFSHFAHTCAHRNCTKFGTNNLEDIAQGWTIHFLEFLSGSSSAPF